ncbi:T9SS type B sorting domain-containing protein [Hwangdonia lutea]|uniref:T9SS type B sorting domain-containing protein n=1 Tax=Hwangdonia lutea TaxID=3075823 RepID=A0AA97EPT8_9FLAO|nr:T9SS type B sorting domain-containing protein [Hwangdonia sp. SCSIO 19198]WOD43928.1 T9SS type B sorting domain-containing protein [Hwangdonia sp. SCSIO 19198]
MKLAPKLFIFFIFLAHNNIAFGQQPTDCIDAVIACGNSNINLNVSGVGTQELSGSNTCSSQENNSVWLKVTLVTSGTLGFTLTPNSTAITEDYDFFVFGPNATCGNIGQAIRCSTTNPSAANQGNNLTGMNSTSTDTAEGPGANGDSFVKWLDVLAGETYFIVIDRPIGNSPFSLQWTGTAQFSDPPSDQSKTSGTPLNLESCDVVAPFDDGFTTFNLTDNTSLITGTQSDITITFHENISDANIGINELSSPYTNINNPQTIHARITNNTTGCFELTSFQLDVNLGPNYAPPADYELCDDAMDGNNTNGRVNFDLSSRNSEILNGQNPADFNITYHTSQFDAENRANPLSNPYYNATQFNEQVFVRIEDALNTDCKSVTPLNLVVYLNPEAYNHTLLQCDEDGTADGRTLFNLNQANAILTNNVAGLSTRFYTDAARTNEVNGNAFTNTANPQTIYVSVVNDATGCFSPSELTLNVSVTDSGDTQLIACDDDGTEDGFFNFNLSDADNAIVSGLPTGLTIAYYETYNDALLETNNLGTTFTNTNPYTQTIYARVENANNCYGISEVALTVNELPNIETEAMAYYCLNFFPDTITLDAAVINDAPSNYSYSWSTGESSYQIDVNQAGTYNVTVSNANGCTKQRTITVEPSNIATFENIEVVDATQNNSISVLVSGEGVYEYRLLDQNNVVYAPYQESNLFENVSPGIYTLSVRDIKNNCGTVQNVVSVIGFPKFFTPNNDGDNDTWQVQGISGMFQPNTNILIFNRFGKLIKQLNPLGEGWDGRFNGQKLPADDYWFAVTLQDGRIFKNHFTLKY